MYEYNRHQLHLGFTANFHLELLKRQYKFFFSSTMTGFYLEQAFMNSDSNPLFSSKDKKYSRSIEEGREKKSNRYEHMKYSQTSV